MIAEFELEFEPPEAHFKLTNDRRKVIEMLYQEKPLGQRSLLRRALAGLAILFSRRRYDDLDVLNSSPHLRRDVGLESFVLRK